MKKASFVLLISVLALLSAFAVTSKKNTKKMARKNDSGWIKIVVLCALVAGLQILVVSIQNGITSNNKLSGAITFKGPNPYLYAGPNPFGEPIDIQSAVASYCGKGVLSAALEVNICGVQQ